VHYYKRNIGDYRRDAGHLSLLEHGVYQQLMDWYYLEEAPIPKETQTVFRRLAARTQDEQNAVLMVLNDFFKLGEKGYTHTRCDLEITEYRAKADKNASNGKRGGRPKKTQSVSSGLPNKSEANPTETLTNKPINQPISKTSSLITPDDVSQDVWVEWVAHRKRKRGAVTPRVIADFRREASKLGMTLEGAIVYSMEKDWRGFEAEWVKVSQGAPPGRAPKFDPVAYVNQPKNSIHDSFPDRTEKPVVAEVVG